jgi:hypothetical protein
LARSHGSTPSGVVWSKKSRRAMSALCPWAAAARRASEWTAPQPCFARSTLTSSTTRALAASSAEDGFAAGGFGFGAGFAGFGAGLAGAGAGFGLADGDGGREGDGETDGDVPGFEPPCCSLPASEAGFGSPAATFWSSWVSGADRLML